MKKRAAWPYLLSTALCCAMPLSHATVFEFKAGGLYALSSMQSQLGFGGMVEWHPSRDWAFGVGYQNLGLYTYEFTQAGFDYIVDYPYQTLSFTVDYKDPLASWINKPHRIGIGFGMNLFSVYDANDVPLVSTGESSPFFSLYLEPWSLSKKWGFYTQFSQMMSVPLVENLQVFSAGLRYRWGEFPPRVIVPKPPKVKPPKVNVPTLPDTRRPYLMPQVPTTIERHESGQSSQTVQPKRIKQPKIELDSGVPILIKPATASK